MKFAGKEDNNMLMNNTGTSMFSSVSKKSKRDDSQLIGLMSGIKQMRKKIDANAGGDVDSKAEINIMNMTGTSFKSRT